MKLQEIFDQLADGEFSQLSIGGLDSGVIAEGNYSKVINHINLALTAIYTRFNLKEGTLELELQDDQTTYQLNSAYAVNGKRSTKPVRYIKDTTDEPFLDDILKVERVRTEAGHDMVLNDAADCYSVTTPSATVLKIPKVMVDGSGDLPEVLDTDTLTVTYRANHPKIVVGLGFFDPERVVLQLPDSHLTPLLYYVASRVNNPVGMTNEFHAGNSYFAKYEQACQALEGQGLQIDRGSSNTRLERNGWA